MLYIKINQLKTYRKQHFLLSSKVIKSDNGKIYTFDLFVLSALNRSISLLKGLINLIKSKNYICAMPLIRLQLDNGLRLFAGTLVKDPHEFAVKVMEGVYINKQKDSSNNLMRDYYLVNKISGIYPWFKDLYSQTSGYIHFSDKHFWNAIKANKESNWSLDLKVTDTDSFITKEDYSSAISDFCKSTKVVFDFTSIWIDCKKKYRIEKLNNNH